MLRFKERWAALCYIHLLFATKEIPSSFFKSKDVSNETTIAVTFFALRKNGKTSATSVPIFHLISVA